MIAQLKKLSKSTTVFCITVLILISLSLLGVATGEKDISKEALVIINEEIITLEDFEYFWNMIPDSYKIQINREDVLEQMITQVLLIQKADELNLRKDPEVAFQIKNTVDQILIQFLLEKEIIDKTTLSDEDLEFYYEENKENYWLEEEVRALNILVETEEQAKEIVERLGDGQEFDNLAKEMSIASTASVGGDIGFIRKGTLLPEIEKQLFILNPGEITEIIPTERGFHIFKVVEKNPAGYLELAEVKEEIEHQLLPLKQQEAFDQYLRNIEDQALIEKNIELLKAQKEE